MFLKSKVEAFRRHESLVSVFQKTFLFFHSHIFLIPLYRASQNGSFRMLIGGPEDLFICCSRRLAMVKFCGLEIAIVNVIRYPKHPRNQNS